MVILMVIHANERLLLGKHFGKQYFVVLIEAARVPKKVRVAIFVLAKKNE